MTYYSEICPEIKSEKPSTGFKPFIFSHFDGIKQSDQIASDKKSLKIEKYNTTPHLGVGGDGKFLLLLSKQ